MSKEEIKPKIEGIIVEEIDNESGEVISLKFIDFNKNQEEWEEVPKEKWEEVRKWHQQQ